MGGIDFNIIGVFVAVVTGIASFFVGRHFRMKRTQKKRERDRIAAQALETRQQRRARERRERG